MCDLAPPELGGRVHLHEGVVVQQGRHQRWFYLRSDADAPLPPYTDRYFEVARAHWGYGPVAADKEKINTLL